MDSGWPAAGMPGWRNGRLALTLATTFASVWRFQTLPLSRWLFANVPSPCVLSRPFGGYELCLDVSRSNVQRLLYLEGERFVAESWLARSLVTPGAVVVDVGANIGYYALVMAKTIGPDGRIIAFEPEPDNLIELRMNVARNIPAMATVHAVAVGGASGQVTFARGINGGVREGAAQSSGDVITVPVVTLDSVLDERVDMIKIDVEGYEGEVLAGARQTIARWKPNLFVEIHPALMAAGHSVDGILEWLGQHYADIRLYQPATNLSTVQKLLSRYTGRDRIVRLNDSDALRAACRARTQETFWAICRRST